jgi:hypothetical protein
MNMKNYLPLLMLTSALAAGALQTGGAADAARPCA